MTEKDDTSPDASHNKDGLTWELPALGLSLRYPAGWQEILEAPDAIDYQMGIDELVRQTQIALSETESPPNWVVDVEAIKRKWQAIVELIAESAVQPNDPDDEFTEAERIETALLTLQANIEATGWEEEGVVFIFFNLQTGEDSRIDIRDIPEVTIG